MRHLAMSAVVGVWITVSATYSLYLYERYHNTPSPSMSHILNIIFTLKKMVFLGSGQPTFIVTSYYYYERAPGQRTEENNFTLQGRTKC